MDKIKGLYQQLKEKLQNGGSYAEGEAIGMVLSMVACFIFIMVMLLIFG